MAFGGIWLERQKRARRLPKRQLAAGSLQWSRAAFPEAAATAWLRISQPLPSDVPRFDATIGCWPPPMCCAAQSIVESGTVLRCGPNPCPDARAPVEGLVHRPLHLAHDGSAAPRHFGEALYVDDTPEDEGDAVSRLRREPTRPCGACSAALDPRCGPPGARRRLPSSAAAPIFPATTMSPVWPRRPAAGATDCVDAARRRRVFLFAAISIDAARRAARLGAVEL